MTDLAMDGLMRELTSEELALIAGGGWIGNILSDLASFGKGALAGGTIKALTLGGGDAAAAEEGAEAGGLLGGPVGAVAGAAMLGGIAVLINKL